MADTALQSVAESSSSVPWPLPLRVAFRFVCCYWLLYALPVDGHISVMNFIPGGRSLFKPYATLWHGITPWVAVHVFHVTGRAATYFPTGSGDTTLAYIQQLLFVLFSLFATAVWSTLDRRRADYRTLHGWLRLLVRYTLAFTLFGYGFAKVFPLQFRPPGFARLIEPYGEFSPMGALWWFMGASVPYVIFSGAAEITGGVLLLFRRTTSLGAMVSSAVMANVVALNFCYDVPVKLYSTNILMMGLFLLAPDLRRLTNVLVLNQPAAPAELPAPCFQRRWARVASTALCVLFVGYNLYGHLTGGWRAYQAAYVHPKHPPLYGLYDVESGDPNWHKVAVEFPNFLTIRTNDDKVLGYSAAYGDQTVTLNKNQPFHWSRPDPDHVLLQDGARTIRLRRIDPGKFLLLSRGFHWINEMPLNR